MKELYNENPKMFQSRPFFFIFCVLLIPVVIGIFILLYWYLIDINTKLIVNEDEICFETGILSKSISEVNISSVQGVKIKQSLIHRMFDVGTIEIYTAGDTPEILAHGMPNPNRIREIL